MKLPKILFAKMVREDKLSYVSASDEASDLVDMGEKVEIGTYELVDRKTLIGTVQAVSSKKKK